MIIPLDEFVENFCDGSAPAWLDEYVIDEENVEMCYENVARSDLPYMCSIRWWLVAGDKETKKKTLRFNGSSSFAM